ncbi:hypothetical protein MOV08_43010 [Streptomyces yunnanensis]|uniref:Uncharacterized protein n=1 Tax=Streptomyces yunnanensis TaxID=156453 RepID=A0ABY8AK81_9ACTN|nr:hypothetical protein [Streptomyces yunnanensis]WEB45397.1 hypothetical protein MOV08_43010 [Streptomyces yunnanensis]
MLASAAEVELTDLTLNDLVYYLPRTTREARGGNPAATSWDPVLNELRERPGSRAAANLAAVLTTPLMVTLARAVYSDTPDHDPAALLDTRRFRTPEELEDHLLDNFTATVYRPRPGHHPGSGSRRTFDPERAQYWLGYLAHHLTRLDTPDLEWWRLGHGLRRVPRTLVTSLVICVAIGLVDGVVGTLFDSFAFQLADGLVAGLLGGLLFGIAYWFMVAAKDTAVEPSGYLRPLSAGVGSRGPCPSRGAGGCRCGCSFPNGSVSAIGLSPSWPMTSRSIVTMWAETAGESESEVGLPGTARPGHQQIAASDVDDGGVAQAASVAAATVDEASSRTRLSQAEVLVPRISLIRMWLPSRRTNRPSLYRVNQGCHAFARTAIGPRAKVRPS